LSAGLRYDLYGYIETRGHNPNGNFCTECPNPATGLPGEVVYQPNTESLFPANKTDFAPRFNLAWTPFHDNKKTVPRAGYDVFYCDATNAVHFPGEGIGLSPGWFYFSNWNSSYYPNQCASFTGTNCVAFPLMPSSASRVTLATPPTVTGYPAQQHALLLGTSLNMLAKPSRDPMVRRWDLEIERQLPNNFLLSVG